MYVTLQKKNHFTTRPAAHHGLSPDLGLCQAGHVDVVLLAVVGQDEILQGHLHLIAAVRLQKRLIIQGMVLSGQCCESGSKLNWIRIPTTL